MFATGHQSILTPSNFNKHFNCPIGFAPILGPVDHQERLYEKEAARQALFNYNASRNFRNIWFHYPEKFNEFRKAIAETWPGMDVRPPEVDSSGRHPYLHMFCTEDRISREICWSGFGFQVWCQMLTHLIQSGEKSLFLIDEPDIYLHSDLQRQLLSLLRNLGPDVLMATHSTEIIGEAETDDIVLIDKRRDVSRRVRNPSQLDDVFHSLGSNLNPTLTQLAKTRRVVFVEGKDFQVLSRFAAQLGKTRVATRSHFAVIPIEGFNPQRMKNLKAGMELTLGSPVVAAAILDRDYRSAAECDSVATDCRTFCEHVIVHQRKEIENFLLVFDAIDRAAERKVADRNRRSGASVRYTSTAGSTLMEFAEQKRNYVMAQVVANRQRFSKSTGSGRDDSTVAEEALNEFNSNWGSIAMRLSMIPGKDALSFLNAKLQERYSISLTPTSVVDAMGIADIPDEMVTLVKVLDEFSNVIVSNNQSK